MQPPRPALLLVLAALGPACALGGTDSRVLLLRHCPRAPYVNDRHPPVPPFNFTNQDNFTARPFPSLSEWGAPQGRCTPNGRRLAQQIGAALPAILKSPHALVVADNVSRCQVSAASLGINTTEVQVDQVLFDPLSARLPTCSQPQWDQTVLGEVKRAKARLEEQRRLLPKLQAVLGKGAAPPLDQIPDNVSGGYFVGALRVASESIIETFELEKTSKMPVGWGEVSDADFHDFSQLRSTYFAAMYGGRDIAQRYASGILARLLQEDLPDATVLLGHDLNLQAVQSLLGIQWRCGPWAVNALPPLSGPLFTLSDDYVRVDYVCPGLSDTGPAAVLGEARFANGVSLMPRAEFDALLSSGIEKTCVNRSLADGDSVVYV